MPCTAKKFEIQRDDEDAAGLPDVDISITTRELARLIKKAQLNFERLPEEKFDDAMGVSTGAAVIFGATGGVMEAACARLRTCSPAKARIPSSTRKFAVPKGLKRPFTMWPAWM